MCINRGGIRVPFLPLCKRYVATLFTLDFHYFVLGVELPFYTNKRSMVIRSLGSNLIAYPTECTYFLMDKCGIVIYSGEVRLVCLAPLTNIALTMKTYAQFSCNLKDIYVMGGNSTGNMAEIISFK
jgi:hypothetical protein